MAESSIAGRSPIFSSPALVPLAAGVVLYGVILFAGNRLLNDPDSYWHLVVGRWIVAHRAFPTADPFSFTMSGHHWIAKEWLSQILYAGAHALAGWAGMAIIAAAAIALAFVFLTRFLTEELAPLPALGLAAVAFVILAPHALARPHALALPVMVAFVGGLVRAVDRNRLPSWWLLPLMVLWANLHGGFTLGILLTGAAGLDAIVEADSGRRLTVALRWIGFAAAVLLAACVTPYGPEFDPRHLPHPRSRTGALDHQGVAAAGFRSPCRIRDLPAPRPRPFAALSLPAPGGPHPDPARAPPSRALRRTERRSARAARAALPGAAARVTISGPQRGRRAREQPEAAPPSSSA